MNWYAVFCNLSTLRCDSQQFFEFLQGYGESVAKINDCLWLLKSENTLPFVKNFSDFENELKTAGYFSDHAEICIIEGENLVYPARETLVWTPLPCPFE